MKTEYFGVEKVVIEMWLSRNRAERYFCYSVLHQVRDIKCQETLIPRAENIRLSLLF